MTKLSDLMEHVYCINYITKIGTPLFDLQSEIKFKLDQLLIILIRTRISTLFLLYYLIYKFFSRLSAFGIKIKLLGFQHYKLTRKIDTIFFIHSSQPYCTIL